ncbi:hypothetical protein IHE61_02830 [Streptomyces sp. GKU 257-1]|nr:hypothetical protein [Streptomyces sp. GKU 257-1]
MHRAAQAAQRRSGERVRDVRLRRRILAEARSRTPVPGERPGPDGGTGSWTPLEDRPPAAATDAKTPSHVTVGRWGRLVFLTCPEDPEHPHHLVIQCPGRPRAERFTGEAGAVASEFSAGRNLPQGAVPRIRAGPKSRPDGRQADAGPPVG